MQMQKFFKQKIFFIIFSRRGKFMPLSPKLQNSKCYFSGQRRARKALFLAFDAAWAGVSHDKISALKSI